MPTDLARRIPNGGALRKNLWASLEPPPDTKAELDGNPATLLSRLLLLELDFGSAVSQDEVEALRRCGEALRDLSEAGALWHELQNFVSEVRVSGGYLDIERMRERLRHFRLRAVPSAEPTLSEVQERTQHTCRSYATRSLTARDWTGRGSRSTQCTSHLPVLLGGPGTGKSALARRWTAAADEAMVASGGHPRLLANWPTAPFARSCQHWRPHKGSDRWARPSLRQDVLKIAGAFLQ